MKQQIYACTCKKYDFATQISQKLKTFPSVGRLRLAAFLRFPNSWSLLE